MKKVTYLALAAVRAGCATAPVQTPVARSPEAKDTGVAHFSSTDSVPPAPPTSIQHATVLTGIGSRLDDADVRIADGKISAVGHGLAAPAGARIVNGQGR